MDQLLSVGSNAPPLVVYLVGMLAIMAGSIFFVRALLLKPRNTEVSNVIPSSAPSHEPFPLTMRRDSALRD